MPTEAQVTVTLAAVRRANFTAKLKAKRGLPCSSATFVLDNPIPEVIEQNPPAPNGRLIIYRPVWINFNFVGGGPFTRGELYLIQRRGNLDPDGAINFPLNQQNLIHGGTTLRFRAKRVHHGPAGQHVWSIGVVLADIFGPILLDPDIENQD